MLIHSTSVGSHLSVCSPRIPVAPTSQQQGTEHTILCVLANAVGERCLPFQGLDDLSCYPLVLVSYHCDEMPEKIVRREDLVPHQRFQPMAS